MTMPSVRSNNLSLNTRREPERPERTFRRHPESPFRRYGGESGFSEAKSRNLLISAQYE
jgi:hypothetical protein